MSKNKKVEIGVGIVMEEVEGASCKRQMWHLICELVFLFFGVFWGFFCGGEGFRQ